MALQLWLPLNGDVKNYGLKNINVLDHGTSEYNQGKIGKCRSFVGSGYLKLTNSFGIESGKDFSCCYWIKEISNNTSPSFRVVYQCGNLIIGHYNDCFNIYNGSDLDFVYKCDTTDWVHCCLTYQSSDNIMTIYINGIKYSTRQLKSLNGLSSATALIGKRNNETYLLEGYLNDFRLYDECLSPKQVKYISQAMICHYPMGNVDGKIGGRNLIRNSKFTNTSWSNNNCGVDIGNTNGSHFDYTTDGIRTVKKSGWGGTGIFIKPDVIPIEYEKTVTLSFDLKLIKFNNIFFSSNANTVGDKSWWAQRVPNTNAGLDAAKKDLNSWHRVSCTIKIPAKNSMYEKERLVVIRLTDNSNGGDYEYYMKNLKLELGNIATPWTPALEDNPPFYDNIIPDISGYQNNGEVTDSTCPTWSNDSPKYLGSYEFNGKNQYISGLSPISNDTKEFTIAFWVKLNNVPNVMTFYTARVGMGSGVALFFTNKNIRFDDNVQSTFNYTYDLSSNKWTHLCVTRNNTSKKLYVNGKLVDSTSNVGNMQNIGKYFTIGGSESSDNGIADMNWLNGNISDFRIYSTVLSDEDILDLYQSSASLDSQGNLILSGEVIE